jgi:hypothetical protein
MVIFGIDSCLILYTCSSRHSPKETTDEELGELSIKDLVSSHCLVQHHPQHSPQVLPNQTYQASEETPLSLFGL